jgi:hypothetical protein
VGKKGKDYTGKGILSSSCVALGVDGKAGTVDFFIDGEQIGYCIVGIPNQIFYLFIYL